jgi:NadR type nicotinamide-nucleotide adenylyltransferase
MDRRGTAWASGRSGSGILIRVCLHGAESTGKSTLARQLGAELGCPVVAEYGRDYAELNGPDFAVADLLGIARRQDELQREAEQEQPPLLLLDTDPLMTAAWAEMLFGEVPEVLIAYPKARVYLLFAPDTPWVDDGTRCFGSPRERARFAAIAEDVLVRTGVPFCTIGGDWDERKRQARAAIATLT